MTRLIAKLLRSQARTEAEAFFCEATPFPLPGALLALTLMTNIVCALLTLLAPG